jgi:hypothetical protein
MVYFWIGFVVGALAIYGLSAIYKYSKRKKGLRESVYRSQFFTTKLKDSIRHIVFEYSIKRSNNDFLFNILIRGKRYIQITHRAHFSELYKAEKDVEFGLAVYVPTRDLNAEQIKKLESILSQESETFATSNDPVPYYVLDLGKRVRYGGYLLTRIIKEIFNPAEEEVTFQLYSEGALPYLLNGKFIETTQDRV